MDQESYRIDILHFRNPYLIWVEKISEHGESKEYCFEQIGLYGVIPAELEPDFVKDVFKTKKSCQWTFAVTKKMVEILSTADELRFSPILIDHYRSSIFDSKCHKFGEIYLIKDDKVEPMSAMLKRESVLCIDKITFHTFHENGLVKTQLSVEEKECVMHALLNAVKTSFKTRSLKNNTKMTRSITHIANQFDKIAVKEHLGISCQDQVHGVVAKKAMDYEYRDSDDMQYLGSRGGLRSTSSSSVVKSKPKPEENKAKSPDDEKLAKVSKWLAKVPEAEKSDNIEEAQFKGVTQRWQNPSSPLQGGPKNTEDNKKPRKAAKRTIPEYDARKEQLVSILPAGASIGSTKLEVRSKFKITPETRKEHFDQVCGEVPDNLWRSTDSEVNMTIRKDNISHDLNSSLKLNSDNSDSNSRNPKLLKDRRLSMLADFKIGKSIPEMLNNDVSVLNSNSLKAGTDYSDKGSGLESLKMSNEIKLESPKVKRSIDDLPFFKANINKDIKSKIPNLSVSNSNYVKNMTDNSNSGREFNSNTLSEPVKISLESKLKYPIAERSKNSLPFFKTANIKRVEKSSKDTKSPPASSLNISDNDITSPSSDTSCSRLQVLKNMISRGNKNEKIINFDETTSSVEPLDTTKSSISISSSKSSESIVTERDAQNCQFNSLLAHKDYLVVDDDSKFVHKVVTPVVMVHAKSGKKIKPAEDLSDMYFPSYIKQVLQKFKVSYPKDLQSFMWPAIMHGCSVFAVGPMDSGKTMGYIPPLSSIVADKDIFADLPKSLGGPLALVVCSTVKSVEHVADKFKSCLGLNGTVLACHSGIDMKKMCELILHGCDVLVSTPGCLKRLLSVQYYSVDFRRLCYAVFDDFERLTDHFKDEFTFLFKKIRACAKGRLNTAFQVKFIVVSKVWNDFMSSLAKQLTNSVVCISAFQECVVYSKCLLNIRTVRDENKTNEMREFLKSCDTKLGRTVIVCKTDEEIEALRCILEKDGYHVFVGGNNFNVEEVYSLSNVWNSFSNSINGNILICCDANLPFINTTNATYLINYSLPDKYSDFCKRFSTLVDNYNSLFLDTKQKVKINVLIDEKNSNQLPKLVNYLKRCNGKIPDSLDAVVERVIKEKDLAKAMSCIPLCDSLLSYGECNDFWHCVQRHSIFKEYDAPSPWVPQDGWIKIKVINYHSVADYSARVLSHITEQSETEFKQHYASLPFKLSTYYSDDNNRRLHGIAEPGDICGVQMKPSYYERCKFIKTLKPGDLGKPSTVLILLIDEEKYESVLDCYLYHLPDALKSIPSYVARIKLAGLQPKDKDLNFTNASKSDLIKLLKTYHGIYLKGRVVLSISNVILIDKLEAYEDLKKVGETIMREDIRQYLLKSHAIENFEHLPKLTAKLGIKLFKDISPKKISPKPKKNNENVLPEPQWAHLEPDDFSLVYFSSAESPEKFYLRLTKYQTCLNDLTVEIQKYTNVIVNENIEENLLKIGLFVLALFPDNNEYHRARIDGIEDDEKCKVFFVDHGDWRIVSKNQIKPLNAELINRLPFQAIECRLHGLSKTGRNWSEMCTNYFCDLCFHANSDELKELYTKYFAKYPSESTTGFKYSVVLIDTSKEYDILINERIIAKNLALSIDIEFKDLQDLSFLRPQEHVESDEDLCHSENTHNSCENKFESLPDFENGEWDVSDDLLGMYADLLKEKNEHTFNVIDRLMENVSSDDSVSVRCPKIVELTPDNEMEIKPIELLISNDTRTTSQMSRNSSTLSKTFEIVDDPKDKIVELDSDDLTSPEVSFAEISKKITPKIKWNQSKNNVTVKIEGADIKIIKIDMKPNRLIFEGDINDDRYAFDIELHNVIDASKSTFTPKALYLLVSMKKLIKATWKSLTADRLKRCWIVYDIDSVTVDSSSNDESDIVRDDKAFKDYALKDYEEEFDSDSGESRMIEYIGASQLE